MSDTILCGHREPYYQIIANGYICRTCTDAVVKIHGPAQTPSKNGTGPPVPEQATGIVWRNMADVLAAPEVEWMVKGIIPVGGSSLLVGAPKAGKTLVVLGIIKAATTGGTFLSSSFAEPSKVWLFTEQGDRSLAAQMRMMHFPFTNNLRIAPRSQQGSFDSVDAFASLIEREYMKAPVKPSLLVLDTLGSFVSIADFNDYSIVKKSLRPMVQLADLISATTATVITHHRRKGGGDGAEGSLGSQRLTGEFDTVVSLQKVPNSEQRKVGIETRFGETDLGNEFNVSLDLATGDYSLTDSPKDQQDAIVSILSQYGSLKRPEIQVKMEAASIPSSESQVRRRLTELVDAGRIEKDGAARSTIYTAV